MRVLHLVSSPTLTGPADPALGLARAQRALLGIDARIAFDRVRAGNMLEKSIASAVPVVDGFRLCTKSGLFSAFSDRKMLRRVARDFDVIHVHTSHDHAIAAAAGARTSIVRSVHHARSAGRRGVQGLAYARTDGFIFVTEAHRARMVASYPSLDPTRMVVVPGAVDTDRFHPGVDGARLREQNRIPVAAFVIGMVARIKPGRRHDLLVEAFDRLRRLDLGDRLHLVLIGKGEGEGSVRKEISRRGLEGAAHLIGFRDLDLPEAIRMCDVTVLLAEGNDAGCRAALESLASGVPVIGARHPAIADALEGFGCGMLIPPDDVEALEAALAEVVRLDPRSYDAWRRAARRRALEGFTERLRVDRVRDFYERLATMGPLA